MTQEVVDHLEEDIITVPGQHYALVSVVSPASNQKTDQCGIKIRGVFNSKEEAASHVKRLQKMDNSFDIFMLEMYKWCCFPPDVSKIEDVHYQEEYLHNIISAYKKSQEDAKQHFQERKNFILENGLDAALEPSEKIVVPEDTHPSTRMIEEAGNGGQASGSGT